MMRNKDAKWLVVGDTGQEKKKNNDKNVVIIFGGKIRK